MTAGDRDRQQQKTGTAAPRRRASPLLLLLVLSTGFWISAEPQHARVRQRDQLHYVAMAANLRESGTLSLDLVPPAGARPRPSSYREPLYPALLALAMRLHPELRERSVVELVSANRGGGHEALRDLLWLQLGLLYLSGLLAGLLFWKLSRNAWLSVLTPLPVWYSTALRFEAGYHMSEPLAACLVTATGLGLLVAFERRLPAAFAGAGLLSGLLALTKAVFAYFWLPVLVATAYLAWRRGWDRRRTVAGLLAFLLAFGAVVGPWLVRNQIHFGRAHIAGRGGFNLYLRSVFDTMGPREYLGAFLVYTPGSWVRELRAQLFGDDELRRLDPDERSPHAFIASALRRQSELLALVGDPARVDRILRDEALRRILADPLAHLAVSVPLGVRGIFAERVRTSTPIPVPALVMGLILFGSSAALWLWACARADPRWLGVLLAPAFCWTFYTLFTQGNARYSAVSLPVYYVCAIWAGRAGYRRAARALRGRRADSR